MGKRGKGKSVRKRSEKALHRKRMRTRKYKASKWKIKNYPNIFKVINYFPYIVRRDDKKFNN